MKRLFWLFAMVMALVIAQPQPAFSQFNIRFSSYEQCIKYKRNLLDQAKQFADRAWEVVRLLPGVQGSSRESVDLYRSAAERGKQAAAVICTLFPGGDEQKAKDLLTEVEAMTLTGLRRTDGAVRSWIQGRIGQVQDHARTMEASLGSALANASRLEAKDKSPASPAALPGTQTSLGSPDGLKSILTDLRRECTSAFAAWGWPLEDWIRKWDPVCSERKTASGYASCIGHSISLYQDVPKCAYPFAK